MTKQLAKLVATTLFISLAACAADYSDPAAYEAEILAFEAQDRVQMPPQGAIVAVGSSSVRFWETIHEDLAPLTVVHRGFGGSDANQALYYMDRIVMPYQPRAILYYEGDNDAAREIPTKKVMAKVRAFVERVHDELPETRIYIVSVKPSISRQTFWPQMQATNKALIRFVGEDERLSYIDITKGMLKSDGRIRDDIFVADELHLNEEGYKLWAAPIRAALMAGEAQYE